MASVPAAPAREPSLATTAAEPIPATEQAPAAEPTPAPEEAPGAEPLQAPEPTAPTPEPIARGMPIEATEEPTAQAASEAAIEGAAASAPAAPATGAPATTVEEALPGAHTIDGKPHLTIRVANRGLLEAEMGGETEPVILEDLTAYGHALANAGGSAEIVLAGSDDMVRLIARRAQRILADTGIDASLPD
jgi:hypothetical protein